MVFEKIREKVSGVVKWIEQKQVLTFLMLVIPNKSLKK
jgi:hypothetical protein